jgi:hypothetical protein
MAGWEKQWMRRYDLCYRDAAIGVSGFALMAYFPHN